MMTTDLKNWKTEKVILPEVVNTCLIRRYAGIKTGTSWLTNRISLFHTVSNLHDQPIYQNGQK